jgi:FAD:protein FMN transferase
VLLFLQKDPKAFHLSGTAQGTTWNITYYARDSVALKSGIDSILSAIDSSLSLYKSYSLIVAFNNSTRGVIADEHLQKVVKRSLEVYKETKGLSDITVGPLVEAWGFSAKQSNSVPSESEVRSILKCVGSGNVKFENDSLIKLKPCVKIDVNGIAQGYTVDVIANYLERFGVANYLVELGGELRVKGRKIDQNRPFRVGIESPSGDDFSLSPMKKILIINNGSITTSGNYRKYYESKGRKYSHIIDPRTGKSVDNEMISATVYAPDAITADALDNALMLMGVEQALKFIEQRPSLAAFLIYRDKSGKIADTVSARFRSLILENVN